MNYAPLDISQVSLLASGDLVSRSLVSESSCTIHPHPTSSGASSNMHNAISFSGSLSKARHVFNNLKIRASAIVKRDIHPSLLRESRHHSTTALPVDPAVDTGYLDLFTPTLPLVVQYERQDSSPHFIQPSLTRHDEYPKFSHPHPYSSFNAPSFTRSSPSLCPSLSPSSPRSSCSSSSTQAPITPSSSEFPIILSVHEEKDPFTQDAVHNMPRNPPHHQPLPSPSPGPKSSTFRNSTSSRPRRKSLPFAPPMCSHPPLPSQCRVPLPPSPEFQRLETKQEGKRTSKRKPLPLRLERSPHTRSTSSILDAFPSPPPTPRTLREFLLTPPAPLLRVELEPPMPWRGNWLDLSEDGEHEDCGGGREGVTSAVDCRVISI